MDNDYQREISYKDGRLNEDDGLMASEDAGEDDANDSDNDDDGDGEFCLCILMGIFKHLITLLTPQCFQIPLTPTIFPVWDFVVGIFA